MSKRKNHSPEFQARRDVFEYIELFYNPKRKHTNNGMLSSVCPAPKLCTIFQ